MSHLRPHTSRVLHLKRGKLGTEAALCLQAESIPRFSVCTCIRFSLSYGLKRAGFKRFCFITCKLINWRAQIKPCVPNWVGVLASKRWLIFIEYQSGPLLPSQRNVFNYCSDFLQSLQVEAETHFRECWATILLKTCAFFHFSCTSKYFNHIICEGVLWFLSNNSTWLEDCFRD